MFLHLLCLVCVCVCTVAWACVCVSPLLTLFPTLTHLTACDWLAAKCSLHTHVSTHTHTHTHKCRKRKVHYTSISGSVLIVMGDRCKVLGSAAFSHTPTHTHTHTKKYRHNLFYTHTRKDINLHPVSFLCWFHTRTHFCPSRITHTHTHTHQRTVQYPFNVLSCSWQQWSEVSLRRVGKKVSCPLH